MKQAVHDMTLKQTLAFLESQHEHLTIEALRGLLAPKLKTFDPFSLDQRLDVNSPAQLFNHVRALLCGTSHKYGYTIEEDGMTNWMLSPYYGLEVGEDVIPFEIPIDGLLPNPGTRCVLITIPYHEPASRPFFYQANSCPSVEAMKRYVAWKVYGILVESDMANKDPEWYEIWLGEQNQVVSRTSFISDEHAAETNILPPSDPSSETAVYNALSFVDLHFIENEMHNRATIEGFDEITIVFGGEKPNWRPYGDRNIYIEFRGFLVGKE